MSYTHLTEAERYDIYEKRREGATLTEIARLLRRSKSTISREVARNSGQRGYRPNQAHASALLRETKKRGGKRVCARTWRRCKQLLRDAYSPDQAAGRAALEGYDPVSHETLYKRIYENKATGGSLWETLRCRKKRRKRYGSGRQRRGKIPNRTGIEQSCPRVDHRATVGHWEGDTIIGRNHRYALISLVERKTGYGLVRKVNTRHADGVAAAIIEALEPIKPLVRTITFDNGLEFSQHERVSAAIDAKVYFADPYSSWQRGTNENWSGLIRQYHPKKNCFSRIKNKDLLTNQTALNNRARKRLAWFTPTEAIAASAKRAGVALAD